ncbi:LuxR C-terminal-related transcriptional regulator [Kribbella sp. NPDC026611]|uniref:ATP-binding protein n=1 Tax=Kribbella sp. NPDC026611 TaxID=3154911 RepID=UPI0033F6243E
MSGAGAEPTALLLGRRSECATLDLLVAEVLGGGSRVLVLRGDAGVGKSALLGYLYGLVAGWRIATVTGVESEMELAYSGLHQLCTPLLNHLERLPGPQRDALATVFGLSAGPVPDPLMVGLATLSLVAEAAEKDPLICVVEDSQWLDRSSVQVFGFVARRLLAERVAFVCAARTGIEDDVFEGLHSLRITGLDDADARTLLLGNMHAPLDVAVSDQIIVESHGNPLALLELPRTWTTADLAGGFGLPDNHAVAGKIERSYRRRLLVLPLETRLLVLTAAAEPLGNADLLRSAAATLGVDMAAAAPAMDDGLVQIRSRVEFAHPLIRSASYRAAAVDDRHRVHRALAQATDAKADPDRHAWHRALATAGPDEDVAAELERSAGRAQARGGLVAAAAFLTRASDLAPDPAMRARLALDAAFANVQTGAFEVARRLLATADAGPADAAQRAQIDMVRALMAFASRRGSEATPLLLAAARRLEPLDPQLARQTYLDAFSAAQFAARLNGGVSIVDVAQAARAVPLRADQEPTPGDLLLDAFSALTDDYAGAIPACRKALQRLRSEEIQTRDRLRWLWQGCVLALEVWDDENAYALSYQHLQTARKTGALSELPLALGSRTPVLVFCGELTAAAALVEEAQWVRDAMGIDEAPYGALTVAAWRGQLAESNELIEITLREAAVRGEGVGVAISEYAHAVLCNSIGRYDEALAAARRACEDPQEMVAHNWGLTELVESATRAGHPELAEEAAERLSTKALASGTDWALGMAARARALLSEGDDAERLFREALERLSQARVRAELARAHLLYGEWLRRSHRRADARAQLSIGYEMFASMGMDGFAERARRELAVAGAAAPKRTFEAQHELTAQEAQIARLARDGLSNPEIGAQLFISARTVEWHLRKVFSKLGVSSRRQLRGTAIR